MAYSQNQQNSTFIRTIGSAPYVNTQAGLEGHFVIRANGFCKNGLKTTQSGKQVANVSVKVSGHPEIAQAFNAPLDQNGEFWINAALWNKDAEQVVAAADQHEQKCVSLLLVGALHGSTYTSKNGSPGVNLEMNVSYARSNPIKKKTGQNMAPGTYGTLPSVPAPGNYGAPAAASAPATASAPGVAPQPQGYARPQNGGGYQQPTQQAYQPSAPTAQQQPNTPFAAPAPQPAPVYQGGPAPVAAPAPQPAPVYQGGPAPMAAPANAPQGLQDYAILEDEDGDLPF